MTDEDWVKTAMTDDSVVVELLVRLQRSAPAKRHASPALSLDWSVRQRRSRSAAKKSTPRNSPTTPLSWSGGATSVSGGGGCEESSRPASNRPDSARSKVHATYGTTSSKRPRKKKTLAELKEEEVSLMKERRQLKRELETLRETLEKQRAQNASLKRFKLDLGLETKVETVDASKPVDSTADQEQKQKGESGHPVPPTLPDEIINNSMRQCPSRYSSSSLEQEVGGNQEDKFVIPDLNEPLEEDSTPDILSRVS